MSPSTKICDNRLWSPAYPAFAFLFGLFVLLQIANLIQIEWNSLATTFFYSSIVLWVLILAVKYKERILSINLLDIGFIAFIGGVTWSVFWSHGINGFSNSYPRYIIPLILAPYICGKLINAQDFEIFSRAILVCGALVALNLIRFLSPDIDSAGRLNIFGVKHGYLLAANFMAIGALVLILEPKSSLGYGAPNFIIRLSQFILLALFALMLCWSGGRGYLVSLIISVLSVAFFSMYSRNYSQSKTIVARIIFFILLAIIALGTSKDSREVSFSGFSSSGPRAVDTRVVETKGVETEPVQTCPNSNANSVDIRSYLYARAGKYFVSHPLAGVGANMFGKGTCLQIYDYPHSTILQAFAELGFLGGGLLVFMYFFSIRRLKNIIEGSNKNNEIFNTESHEFYTPKKHSILLGLMLFQLVADQIYGNYFSAAAQFLYFGMVSSLTNVTERMTRGGA